MFVPREATILHADLDAFFASVEQRDDPGLRARPVIVGGGRRPRRELRGAAPSACASAMGGARARRLCPEAIVVPPRFAAYVEASKAVKAIFEDTAPTVEGVSIDEAFLDVRGLRRSRARRSRSRRGCAARCASRSGCRSRSASRRRSSSRRSPAAWRSPTACCSSTPTSELAFLHPLPVGRLWGVGAVTDRKLHDRGIRIVGDLAAPARPRSSRSSGARRGATCTTRRSTATCGRCAPAGGGARSARSARSGATR